MSFTTRFKVSGVKKIYGSKKKRPVSPSSNDLQSHKRTSGDVSSLPVDPRPAADRSQPAFGLAGPSSKKPDDADVTPSPSAKEEEPSQTPSAKSGAQSVSVSATAGAASSEKSGTPTDKDSAGGGGGEATPTSTTEDGQPKGTPAQKDKGPIAPRGVPVSGGSSKKPADDADGSVTPSPSAKEESSQTPSATNGDQSAPQVSATLGAEDEKDADALPGTSAPPPMWPPMAPFVEEVMAKTGLNEVKAACALFFATPPFTVSAAVKLGNSKDGEWFRMKKKPFMNTCVGPKLFNVSAWWNEPADENAADMLAFRLYSNITTEIKRHASWTEADLRRVFPIIYHCYLDLQTPAHSGKTATDMIAYHLPAYKDAAPPGSEIKDWSVRFVRRRYYKYLGESAPKVPPGGACTLATENLQGITRDYVPNQEMIDLSAMSAAYWPSSMVKNPLLQFRSSMPTYEHHGEMEEEVPGIIVRVLHDWAVGRLSRFRLPPPPLNLPPPPANAHPAAVKMVHEKFKDNPQVIALFYSDDYLEACYPIALKFITMLATNSLFLKDFTEVYVIFEQLPKEEQCLFNLVLLLIYVGIALQTEERLSREKAHRIAIGKPNGKIAGHNRCLYRAAAQSLAGGINICRMTPFSPKLSNQGGALVELANIHFLRKLSGQELLNKQFGSSSMAGPAVDMLSDEELVTLGAVFFLWAFKRDALYAPVLKYATGHPPQKIPYFRLRLNDQLIADLQAEVAEENVEEEEADED